MVFVLDLIDSLTGVVWKSSVIFSSCFGAAAIMPHCSPSRGNGTSAAMGIHFPTVLRHRGSDAELEAPMHPYAFQVCRKEMLCL